MHLLLGELRGSKFRVSCTAPTQPSKNLRLEPWALIGYRVSKGYITSLGFRV